MVKLEEEVKSLREFKEKTIVASKNEISKKLHVLEDEEVHEVGTDLSESFGS